jgi:hypothetical protein
MAISADAVTKCCRLANCGAAQRDIQPSCRNYFAAANEVVQQRVKDGTLPNLGQDSTAGSSAPGHAADCEQPVCTANLHCSRAAAAPRGDTDRSGIAGVVCAHTFPGKELFLGMPTPEQHAFYDFLFTLALKLRPDIRDIYLDLGCRYRIRFQQLLQVGGICLSEWGREGNKWAQHVWFLMCTADHRGAGNAHTYVSDGVIHLGMLPAVGVGRMQVMP